MTGCLQVTTTLPDRAAAERLAARLVGDRLAACAQVVGPVASTYRWGGEVETSQEWYCHLKTSSPRLAELIAAIRRLHSYEVPEIVALPIVDGDPAYLRWIEQSVAITDRPPGPGSPR